MYGVVLWSDSNDKKAVIWCEDHGDLAYYGGPTAPHFDDPLLEAGDLVTFQVTEGAPMRMAQDPKVVDESYAPELAQRLRETMGRQGEPQKQAEDSAECEAGETANIIPFRMAFSA